VSVHGLKMDLSLPFRQPLVVLKICLVSIQLLASSYAILLNLPMCEGACKNSRWRSSTSCFGYHRSCTILTRSMWSPQQTWIAPRRASNLTNLWLTNPERWTEFP